MVVNTAGVPLSKKFVPAKVAHITSEKSTTAVADRIELKTADMRELPFADGSFDVVVSNVAIHNIGDAAGRDRAIDEAWRVLRPGGRLLIADISKSHQYRNRLAALGVRVVRRSLGSHVVGWPMDGNHADRRAEARLTTQANQSPVT